MVFAGLAGSPSTNNTDNILTIELLWREGMWREGMERGAAAGGLGFNVRSAFF